MSKYGKYIPGNKLKFAAWLLNFMKKLLEYVNHYGINQEEIKIAKVPADEYLGDMTTEREILNKKRAQFKKTAKDRKEIEAIVRKLAQTIKSSLDYDEEIGREFDIIGTHKEVDEDNAMPVLELQQVPHGWELSFGLEDYFDGVNIYRQRPNETDFSYLATDTHSPYVDNEPMVNGTQYCAYFIIGDTEVGKRSAIVKISI
jgi:hypothetical protein